MKLQGKKTGAFANFVGYIDQATPTIDLPTGNTMLTVRYMDSGVNWYKDYKTIAEFNKDWEDYTPTEPLIKDEKIRKVVKLWAEINKIIRAVTYDSSYDNYWYIRAYNDNGNCFDLDIQGEMPKEIIDCEPYTIAELCGEEEECES